MVYLNSRLCAIEKYYLRLWHNDTVLCIIYFKSQVTVKNRLAKNLYEIVTETFHETVLEHLA